jgi:hypothetical protein
MHPKLRILRKELVCSSCKINKHHKCYRNIEVDIRKLNLNKDETLANYAIFRTGKFHYVFKCTCNCQAIN